MNKIEATCKVDELKSALDALIQRTYTPYDFTVIWQEHEEDVNSEQ